MDVQHYMPLCGVIGDSELALSLRVSLTLNNGESLASFLM